MKGRRPKAELRNQRSAVRSRLATAATSSFCVLYSAFRISHCRGQALIEFTVAIAAIMSVVIGLMLLNRIESASLDTITAARGKAGDLCLSLIYQGAPDAQFISDWQAGPDDAGYTHDDEAKPDLLAPALIDTIAGNAEMGGPASLATNAVSRLDSAPDPISEFYLVKGSESREINLSDIPAARSLFTREETFRLESDVWLTWTEGIY